MVTQSGEGSGITSANRGMEIAAGASKVRHDNFITPTQKVLQNAPLCPGLHLQAHSPAIVGVAPGSLHVDLPRPSALSFYLPRTHNPHSPSSCC